MALRNDFEGFRGLILHYFGSIKRYKTKLVTKRYS